MKKYLVEGIGTFFLVLTVVLTANNGAGTLAPLAIGAALMVMVYAGGHVSGGHFNPAVSLAVFLRGKLDRAELPYYLLAQIAGALAAALIAVFLLSCGNGGAANIQMRVNDPICALVAEFLGAFVLAYVVLNVSTTAANAGNSFYGLAIGFTMLTAAYALGSISGGAFNPAIGVGTAVAGMTAWSDIWIYFAGPLLGGSAAATVFQLTSGD